MQNYKKILEDKRDNDMNGCVNIFIFIMMYA